MPDREREDVEENIRQIFLHDWDPTGISAEPLARHAYDSYIGPVYSLLTAGVSAQEIADHLSDESRREGLSPTDSSTLLSVAGKLKALDLGLSDGGKTEPRSQGWAEGHPILAGLGTLLTLHALVVLGPLQGMTSLKGSVEPFLIGVVQLWYVVPLGVCFYAAGWRRTLRVFAMGAVTTFLVNLAACAYMWSQLKNIGK
jgi:hypothetical protein